MESNVPFLNFSTVAELDAFRQLHPQPRASLSLSREEGTAQPRSGAQHYTARSCSSQRRLSGVELVLQRAPCDTCGRRLRPSPTIYETSTGRSRIGVRFWAVPAFRHSLNASL